MYPNWSGYEEDINLDLPFVGNKRYIRFTKRLLGRGRPMSQTRLPEWNPQGIERLFFQWRDRLWTERITRSIDQYGLLGYDVYHFHAGVDLFRDGRFARRLKSMGKKIVCHYHGTDLRDRGVIPVMDELSDLNLTCEFDHLSLHPGLRYLFLPFEVGTYEIGHAENKRIRVCHSPTNRFFKGSNVIIQICRDLERQRKIEFVLIEGKPHSEVIRIKQTCDMAIDQIANLGGLGYGVNSLETLSMGIPTCTNLTPEYEAFIPDHPFILIDANNLERQIEFLVGHPEYRKDKGREGRAWVERVHGAQHVVRHLYTIYEELGWCSSRG